MDFTFSGMARTLALSAALAVTVGCTERRTAERADSDLSHDLALAGQITAQPALKDTAIAPPPASVVPNRQAPPREEPRVQPTTPQAPPQAQIQNAAPVATQPATTTTGAIPATDSSVKIAPAPVQKVIVPGTGVALSSGMRICTTTNKVGDKLVATVTNPVQGDGGAMIPTGSRVVLEVAQLTPGDSPDSSRIVLQPTTMYVNGLSYPVNGDISSTTAMQRIEAPGTGGSDTKKVVGGAAVGAILGQIFGHSTKSTVIGAAAGAATGAVVAHATQNYQVCLPEGASLVMTLNTPLIMN